MEKLYKVGMADCSRYEIGKQSAFQFLKLAGILIAFRLTFAILVIGVINVGKKRVLFEQISLIFN